jgi:DnaJ-class molecular chaperone
MSDVQNDLKAANQNDTDQNPGDKAPSGAEGTGEDLCPDCKGSGRVEAGKCETCGGSGTVTEGVGGG